MILFILASSVIPSRGDLVDPPVETAPSLQEVVERYAKVEEYYEDFVIKPDFELLEGYYPWLNQDNSPNLKHLRGSRTRWQKGVASVFG
jgi:hypothetical protein